jgi:cytochrome c oxidase cbb3-type subunit 2
MIRPFRAETERYGHYSVAGEFVYDHPFQWGSKRTGPDLHRVGGRYSDEWHACPPDQSARRGARVQHAGFCLPGEYQGQGYCRCRHREEDGSDAWFANVRGIPTYTDEEIKGAKAAIGDKTELDVLIAYLQGMGTALKNTKQ